MAAVEKSNAVPRQRTFTSRPGDEESAIINGVPPDELDRPQDRSTLNSASEKQSRRHVVDTEGLHRFWLRFTRHGKKSIGVRESLHAIIFSSCEPYILWRLCAQVRR
jgi:Ca2+:H+ antiporter